MPTHTNSTHCTSKNIIHYTSKLKRKSAMSIIYILCCKIKSKTVTKGIHQKLPGDAEEILQEIQNTVDCILGLLAMTTATHDGGVVFTV